MYESLESTLLSHNQREKKDNQSVNYLSHNEAPAPVSVYNDGAVVEGNTTNVVGSSPSSRPPSAMKPLATLYKGKTSKKTCVLHQENQHHGYELDDTSNHRSVQGSMPTMTAASSRDSSTTNSTSSSIMDDEPANDDTYRDYYDDFNDLDDAAKWLHTDNTAIMLLLAKSLSEDDKDEDPSDNDSSSCSSDEQLADDDNINSNNDVEKGTAETIQFDLTELLLNISAMDDNQRADAGKAIHCSYNEDDDDSTYAADSIKIALERKQHKNRLHQQDGTQ